MRSAEEGSIASFRDHLAGIEAETKAEAEHLAALARQVNENWAATFFEQQNALRETIKQQMDANHATLEIQQQDLIQKFL